MKRRPISSSTSVMLVFISILLLFCCHLRGLDPAKPVDQYLLDKWDAIDGMISETVISIAQTADGYLWLGTTKGLIRFDGTIFSIVPFSQEEEVYSQDVRALFVDREGNLWIGNALGLTFYNFQTKTFKSFTVSDGITGDGIRRINSDLKGDIWISFDVSFVNRFDGSKFTSYNSSHGLSAKRVNAIVEDRQGHLLFGTKENGLFTYTAGKFFIYPVPELGSASIVTMHEDRSGDLWIGSSLGLVRIHHGYGGTVERITVKDGLTGNYITSFVEDYDGNLWVGTSEGLNRLSKNQDGTIFIEGLLNKITIFCLFEDKEKSLWIGTDGFGLKRLKDGIFKSFDGLLGEMPSALFEDREGDTWIGTIKGSLFSFRGENGGLSQSPEIPGLAGTGIAAIGEDGDGHLWLGTGKGAIQEKNGRYTRFTTEEGLADNQVVSIYRDSRNNLWFSTFDGVSVRGTQDGRIRSLRSADGLSGKRVYSIIEDTDHNIWIAADGGIAVLAEGRTTAAEMRYYLQGVPVASIYEDPASFESGSGIFWIATSGAGLKRLNVRENTINNYKR